MGGPDGLLLNWNNKPAPGWQTGDDNRSYGSVHRVEMFDDFPRKARIADVVSIMNRAATEDLRATVMWPVIRKVLGRSAPPDALTGQAPTCSPRGRGPAAASSTATSTARSTIRAPRSSAPPGRTSRTPC